MKKAYALIGFGTVLCILLFVRTVKGNGDSMIYHVPGCNSYHAVSMSNHPADRYFFTEDQARMAGYRKANNCY